MTKKVVKKQRESVFSPDYRKVYANAIQLQVSVWDFRFNFGDLLESSDELVKVEEQVRVTMSPQHTKAFLGLLITHVQKYEAVFGEIKVSPNDDAEGVEEEILSVQKG
jgi:hypothetical protein